MRSDKMMVITDCKGKRQVQNSLKGKMKSRVTDRPPLKWQAPRGGWFKANVNGTFDAAMGEAGLGGTTAENAFSDGYFAPLVT